MHLIKICVVSHTKKVIKLRHSDNFELEPTRDRLRSTISCSEVVQRGSVGMFENPAFLNNDIRLKRAENSGNNGMYQKSMGEGLRSKIGMWPRKEKT